MNPDVMRKLQDEVNDVCGDEKIKPHVFCGFCSRTGHKSLDGTRATGREEKFLEEVAHRFAERFTL